MIWSAGRTGPKRPRQGFPVSRPLVSLPGTCATALRATASQVDTAAIVLDPDLLRAAENDYDRAETTRSGACPAPPRAPPSRRDRTKGARAAGAGQGTPVAPSTPPHRHRGYTRWESRGVAAATHSRDGWWWPHRGGRGGQQKRKHDGYALEALPEARKKLASVVRPKRRLRAPTLPEDC